MEYTEWRDFHTNSAGEGLWNGDKQCAGTLQFTVRGCKTEKAAKAKIREWVKKYRPLYWDFYDAEIARRKRERSAK